MTTRQSNVSLDEVVERTVDLLAAATSRPGHRGLSPFEQRLAVELYRLLAEGEPVPRTVLAERLSVPVGEVNEVLDRWPGVFSDAQQRVVGFWGVSLPAAYASPHRLTIAGRTLSAWCAWDTLFLPHLLGQTAEIESQAPDDGGTVRLTVTPERVAAVDPTEAHMSYLLPDAGAVQENMVASFCHFVYFFASRAAGERWTATHAGTFLLPVGQAFVLGRRKNEAQYPELFA